MDTEKGKVINIKNEKFMPVGKKILDSKKRLSIGEKLSRYISKLKGTNEFEVYYGDEGDILLRPMVSIPLREAWIYKNPAALKLVRKGLHEAKDGKAEKIEDLDKFFDEL